MAKKAKATVLEGPSAAGLAFPRWMHKAGGETRLVEDVDGFEAAIEDGWSAQPVAVYVTKQGHTEAVYTASALATALKQGWTVIPTE